MGEHQQNYYIREKAAKTCFHTDPFNYWLDLSGGVWGVTISQGVVYSKLSSNKLKAMYINFVVPYRRKGKNKELIPIHIRASKSRW